MRTLLLATAIACIPLAQGYAAEETWQTVLRTQLQLEQDCIVTDFEDPYRPQVNGKPALFVKARCLDTREFDASRMPGESSFKLVECSRVAC